MTRFSTDGLFYWDGQQWVTALSPDGRYRWNGAAWIPVEHAVQAPAPTAQTMSPGAAPFPVAQPTRQPTSWTRPLQIAVVALYAIQSTWGLVATIWMAGPMNDYIRAVIAQSQKNAIAQDPTAPPPPDLTPMITAMMPWILGAGALVGLAIALVAIIGAVRRWVWAYYAVMVLLGLGAISTPLNLLQLASGTSVSRGIALPAALTWVTVANGAIGAALFVWMLVALLSRGPWGMRRPLPAH